MRKKQSTNSQYNSISAQSLQPSFARQSIDSHLPWKTSEQRQAGPHSGKGPKGYRRSDERIREDVSEALTQHPEIDAREIEVKVKDAVVTLSGTIESRHLKTLAEDCVEEVRGVNDVNNELRIDATLATKDRTSEFSARESTSLSVRT